MNAYHDRTRKKSQEFIKYSTESLPIFTYKMRQSFRKEEMVTKWFVFESSFVHVIVLKTRDCLWIFICSWNLAMNSSALRSISFSSSGILSLYSSSSTPFKKLLHPPSSHSYSSSSKSTCGVVQGMLNRTGPCILTWKIGVLSKKSWRSPWWSWVRVVWPWARLLRNWGKTRSSTIKRLLKTPPFLAHKQCYTQDVPCSMIFSCHFCIWVVEKSKSWEFVWVVLRFSRGAC